MMIASVASSQNLKEKGHSIIDLAVSERFLNEKNIYKLFFFFLFREEDEEEKKWPHRIIINQMRRVPPPDRARS